MRALWTESRLWVRVAIIAASLLAIPLVALGLLALQATRADLETPPGLAPTRIYARPLVLYVGMRPDPDLVEEQLLRLDYVLAPRRTVLPRQYRLGPRTWIIGRRPFRHHEKLAASGLAVVRLDSWGRVTAIEDEAGQRLSHVFLEPELIGSFHGSSREDRIQVHLSDVPRHLVDAVLAVEDQRFFEHGGLDVKRIVGAALANLRAGRVVQGGSTLTQQLARARFLTPHRTLVRKVREAAIALSLERRYSKEEILEAYLNEVYLGQAGALAVHGVGRAAQHYFGKDVSALDLSEAALLAGLIRGPSLYSPLRRQKAARERRDLVLKLMVERGAITPPAFEAAREAGWSVRAERPAIRSTRYFVDFIEERLLSDHEVSGTDGLAVFTSLDMRLQEAAEEAVRVGLMGVETQYAHLTQQGAPLQAALVALDPRTGQVLAMVGGRDYGESQFNRAVKARRQPGSAFKPIVALAALARQSGHDDGEAPSFTLASVLHDERLVVETPQGPWEPVNYDRRFRGPISLREALERSLNVPFARLGLEVGPPRIVETARQLGIEGPLRPVPSIALGSMEVTPLELTRAYGVLAATGYRADLRPILGILDREGNAIEGTRGSGVRVFDPTEAYLVTSALRGAVERGTGRALRSLGFRGEVAAKSGTTNNFRDGWFIGYTPSLVVGVWVGFDEGRSINLTGSRAALPIFARFLFAAIGRNGDLGDYGGVDFEVPDGLEVAEVDPETGLLAGPGCPGRLELFLRGTVPRRSCSSFWRLTRSRRTDERWEDEIARLRHQLLRLLEQRRASGRQH